MQRREILKDIFEGLAQINSEISQMDSCQLIERLKYYGLDTEGNDKVRKKRLMNKYKTIKLADLNVHIRDILPYYVVIDFEATCTKEKAADFQPEIIEFPAVLVNSATKKVDDSFQMYCKPVINPKLSAFCVQLTGITQEQVDAAQTFEDVLKCFENWLKKHKLWQKYEFAIVTDSPWDMSRFLLQQCINSNIPYPKWAEKWFNVNSGFSKFYKCRNLPIKGMLKYVGLRFEGRLHCGLDDAKNIARVLLKMISDGADILPNEKIANLPKRINFCNPNSQPITTEDVKTDKNNELNDEKELNGKMKNLRFHDIEYFTVIEKRNRFSTYGRVKSERGKLEAKLNRELKNRCIRLEEREEIQTHESREKAPPHKEHNRKIEGCRKDVNRKSYDQFSVPLLKQKEKINTDLRQGET